VHLRQAGGANVSSVASNDFASSAGKPDDHVAREIELFPESARRRRNVATE